MINSMVFPIAAQAEKTLERIKAEGLIEKPFVPKKKTFTFPPVEKMGQRVLSIEVGQQGVGGGRGEGSGGEGRGNGNGNGNGSRP